MKMYDRTSNIILIASFLVGSKNLHGGAFNNPNQNKLASMVRNFITNSPLLSCYKNYHVHIVTDASTNVNVRNVHIHRVDKSNVDGGVWRFNLYGEILRNISYECVFMVDLTDVNLINPIPCNTFQNKLYIGSDGGSPKINKWLMKMFTPITQRHINPNGPCVQTSILSYVFPSML